MLTLSLLDSKWKELNQVTSERQQKLEESSNYLTQFQTAEAQLKHWLVEKELMVSVLGPLSIDPNMLNTQKQQVQVSKDCQYALMVWFLLLLVGLCIVCCFFLLLAKQYLAFRVSTDQVIGAMLFISKYQPKVLLATAIRRKNYHENEEIRTAKGKNGQDLPLRRYLSPDVFFVLTVLRFVCSLMKAVL